MQDRRRDYKSLDEMAQAEGVERVLDFLSNSPTVIGDYYRHTDMKTVPYIVRKSESYYVKYRAAQNPVQNPVQNHSSNCCRPT